jgi:hypothetical protein
MSKGLLIIGLILLIIGILPIILPLIGFGAYAAYFYLGFFTFAIGGFAFSEVMLILIILGVILLIVGAVK